MQRNTQSLIETQNLRSYFSEELTRASENQSIEIDEEVAAYLTQLLTEFSNPSALFDKTEDGIELKPLALYYLAAVEAENRESQNLALRRLGDIALFISGLFPASLNRKVMDVFPDGEYGKHAVTHHKMIERLGFVTVVECKLETGRTHQIRAHMKHIGHPLFGDFEYGGDKLLKGTSFTKYSTIFFRSNIEL